jgi:quinol-cytochrome oxidoreductase complex cytochrome b subunit
VLLPLFVGVLVIVHLLLVRRHGVVPPFDARPPDEAARPSIESDASHPAIAVVAAAESIVLSAQATADPADREVEP